MVSLKIWGMKRIVLLICISAAWIPGLLAQKGADSKMIKTPRSATVNDDGAQPFDGGMDVGERVVEGGDA